MIVQLVCNLRLSRSGMSDTGSSNYSFRKSVIQRPVIEQVFYKTLGDPPHWTYNCYHVSTCVLWLPHWSYHCYYVSMSYDSHRWIHIDLNLRSPSRTVQQRKRWRTSLRVILATQSIFKNNPSLTPSHALSHPHPITHSLQPTLGSRVQLVNQSVSNYLILSRIVWSESARVLTGSN